MIDLHCHILPGIDDGPGEPAGSLAMARELAEMGFTRVCATPHVPWGSEWPSAGDVKAGCERLAAGLLSEGIDLTLVPAAEHFSLVVPELLAEERLVCFPRGDTFLMEFPLSGFPERIWDLLFRLQVKGKVPVIAHVERYPEVQKDPAVVQTLKDKGCFVLINLTSLRGKWSRQARTSARELAKRGLVDAVSTDMHTVEEASTVAEGLEDLGDIVGEDVLRALTRSGPAGIAGLPQDRETRE